MTQDSFFDQPYSNRQLVLFMDDAAIAASEKASKIKTSTSYRAFAVAIASILAGGVTGNTDAIRLGMALAETIISYREAKNEGVENLILVAKSKINLFQLPPGHPRNSLVLRSLKAIGKAAAIVAMILGRSTPDPRFGSPIKLSGRDASGLLNLVRVGKALSS